MAECELERALAGQEAGDLQAAADLCLARLAADPADAGGYYGLGLIAHRLGQRAAAVELLGQAHRHDPAEATYLYALGIALLEDGREETARQCFQNAVILSPGFASAHNNLGVTLAAADAPAAIASFRRAIALDPAMADPHYNLAKALRGLGRLDEAITHYRHAIALQPGMAVAYNNLGIALAQQNRLEEAVEAYRTALTFAPDLADAHYNLGTALLTLGDFAGFAAYEWRWQTPQMQGQKPAIDAPDWDGAAGCGRSLLIRAEQGLGDTLQFCRLVPRAAARGWHIVFQVQAPLRRLLQGLADEVISFADPAPSCAAYAPLLSLPHLLRLTREEIPPAPYLGADPARWLAALPAGPRVGLAWAGNPRRDVPAFAAVDARRSLDPALLAPLAALQGFTFVSLQKSGPPAPFHLIDVMDQMHDFADTAALVAALDLVITVDTAIAHLAGALGRPVWLLNRFDTCWRWGLHGRTTPWYPTLTIYRQRNPGDWQGVIADVAVGLLGFSQQGQGALPPGPPPGPRPGARLF